MELQHMTGKRRKLKTTVEINKDNLLITSGSSGGAPPKMRLVIRNTAQQELAGIKLNKWPDIFALSGSLDELRAFADQITAFLDRVESR